VTIRLAKIPIGRTTSPAGTYFIKVVADSEGKVREASESNNVGVSPAILVAPM
jgi:hypothetical protein